MAERYRYKVLDIQEIEPKDIETWLNRNSRQEYVLLGINTQGTFLIMGKKVMVKE
jgi:hypothetical protein